MRILLVHQNFPAQFFRLAPWLVSQGHQVVYLTKNQDNQLQVVHKVLFEEKKLPVFPYEVEKISYRDGVKVYFENGGWVIARFSGTEPLIRIFTEMPYIEDCDKVHSLFKEFLKL
jgi:phosphomannomutase